jgi:hypothetical protein
VSSYATYKVVLGVPPVETADEHRQDIACYQNIYHQRVLPHPLHGNGRCPEAMHIHLKHY